MMIKIEDRGSQKKNTMTKSIYICRQIITSSGDAIDCISMAKSAKIYILSQSIVFLRDPLPSKSSIFIINIWYISADCANLKELH
jgi:hypothetical protein